MKTTFGLKCLTTTLILCLSITGCKQYGNSFNGNIKHIKFPQEQNLKGERLHYINSIGFYGCDLNYPYLVLSLAKQEAQTAIYDLERKKFMGDYFHIGQGPDDFTSFVIINQNKDSLLGINDVYKRELKIINLYQTIKTQKIVYQQVLKYKEHNADNFIALNADSVLWVKSYENNQLIYKHTDQIKNMYADPLYRNTLNQMQTLSDAIKRDGSKIVSLTGILDQIDILSLTPGGDNISVTASADKTLPTIHEQQEEHFQNTTDFYLSIPRCNNDYIMVLYQSPQTQTKELQLIDWDGNGLCRYLLEEDLIDFCIDWNRKTIYGITDAEAVFKYDLPLP